MRTGPYLSGSHVESFVFGISVLTGLLILLGAPPQARVSALWVFVYLPVMAIALFLFQLVLTARLVGIEGL